MARAEFSVPWVKGKERPRVSGRGLRKTDSERMAEEAVALAYREAGGAMAPDGAPVRVTVELSKEPPSGADGVPFTCKPDADNACKLVLDALNGVAWRDDAQVTALAVGKLDRTRGCGDRTRVTVEWEDRDS